MITGISSSVGRARTFTNGIAHLAGGGAGGSAAGALAWLAATPVRTLLPHGFAAGALLSLGVAATAHEIGQRRGKFGWGRQVPGTWRYRFGEPKAFAGFGFLLGGGIFTYAPFAATYVVFAYVGLMLPIGAAVLAGVLFGSARSTAVLLGLISPHRIQRWLFLTGRSMRVQQSLSAAVAITLSLVALGVAPPQI
jgi:hypothetical protein